SGRLYGSVTLDGVSGGFFDIIIENAVLTGQIDGLAIGNAFIQNVYFDLHNVNTDDYLNMPEPENVNAASAAVSESFYAENRDFVDDLIGLKENEEETNRTLQELFLSIGDIESKQNVSTAPRKYMANETAADRSSALPLPVGLFNVESGAPAWFSISLAEGDTVQLTYQNYDALGFILAESPSGFAYSLSSSGEPQNGSFTTSESGTYYLNITGARFSADVSAEVIEPLAVDLTVDTANSFPSNEDAFTNGERLSAFELSLYDVTDSRYITGFTVHNGRLLLPPSLAGHLLRVDAVHNSIDWGNYWSYQPASAEFTAGETSSVSVICRRYGEYSGWSEDFSDARGYIYNDDGRYIASLYSDGSGFWSEPMPDGEYAVVFIRDPGGNYRFPKIEDYRSYGFKAKRDYVLDEFTNTAGVITRYDNLKVPDAPVLSYGFLEESSGFAPSSSSGVAGSMIEFTLTYDFIEAYDGKISNLELTLDFSDDCVLYPEAGIRVNGETLPVSVSGNILTAELPVSDDVSFATVTVSTEKANTQLLAVASLSFEADGERAAEFAGAANVNIVSISINGPNNTGRDHVPLYGYASSNQTVSVYDGDYLVAATQSREDGFWSLEAPLSPNYGYTHELRAVLYAGTPGETPTQSITVEYSPIYPNVENFVFRYHVHDVESTITISGEDWGKTKFSYEYWPGDIFSFDVTLTNSQYVDRFWVTSTEDNSYQQLEGFYDEERGIWIASGQFSDDPNYMPGDFLVEWTMKEDADAFDYYFNELEKNSWENYDAGAEKPLNTYTNYTAENSKVIQLVDYGNEIEIELLNTLGDEIGNIFEEAAREKVQEATDKLYDTIPGQAAKMWAKEYELFLYKHTLYVYKNMLSDDIGTANLIINAVHMNCSGQCDDCPAGGCMQIINTVMQSYSTYIQKLNDLMEFIDAAQKDLNAAFAYTEIANYAKEKINKWVEKKVDALVEKISSGVSEDDKEELDKYAEELKGLIDEAIQEAIDSIIDDLETTYENARSRVVYESEAAKETFLTAVRKGVDQLSSCDSCEPDEEDDPPGRSPGGGPDPRPDPSGFVYEAVVSNRLAGVTARVYYRAEDGSAVLWNAAEYGALNPQITGADGAYEWFVPRGFWRVSYDLDGYEHAESPWMEVPPPRVDVNQALSSSRSALVTYATLNTDYAEVTFDKYLDTAAIGGLISAAGLNGTVSAVNPEASGLGDGKTYANVFRLTFDTKANYGQSYKLNVAGSALCYAGVANSPYSADYVCSAVLRSASLELPKLLESGKETKVALKLDMDQGFETVDLSVTSAREDLLHVTEIGGFDANGVAYVTLSASKAGATSLTLTA
ncbi:MAG: hypothetical protein LBN97_10295, partial [Oscillospiraceae bacterium]|nr:hypothetical protein [Oscillospiraceae bacterium]